MDQNTRLLNAIYNNAQMAFYSVETLMPKAEQTPLYGELGRQQAEYQRFSARAADLLHNCGKEAKAPGAMQRAALWAGIHGKTMLNSSPSHIAQMMIEGGQMGTADLKNCLKHKEGCSRQSLQLGQELLDYEQATLMKLKSFLQQPKM